MASIERISDNTYRIVVSNGYDAFGKKLRARKTITIPDNLSASEKKKELNRQAVLFEEQVKNGKYLDGNKITLAQFIELWLKEYAEERLAPSTLNVYKTRIEKRIIPALGHIKLAKLQPNHILKFCNMLKEKNIRLDNLVLPTKQLLELLNQSNEKDVYKKMEIDKKTYDRLFTDKGITVTTAQIIADYFQMPVNKLFHIQNKNSGLSEKTIKHHYALLSSILTAAVQWQIIDSNPASKIPTPKVKKHKANYYTKEQVILLLSALENEKIKYKAIIYAEIDTGLRLSELMGIKWADLDMEKKQLTIDKERQYIPGYGIFEKAPKTESGDRIITLSDTTINILNQYKKNQIENKLKLGEKYFLSDYIFVHENGNPIFPNRPSVWLGDFLKKNNLPHIKFHELRHTNVSILISEGIDPVTVSKRVGHSDKNITLRIYAHAMESKDSEAAKVMDTIMNPKTKYK